MTLKKILSMLLAVSIVIGLLSTGVFATDPQTQQNLHVSTELPTTIGATTVCYLGANVNGTIYMISGTSNETHGVRSFPTTTSVNDAKQVYVEYWKDHTNSDTQAENDPAYHLIYNNTHGIYIHNGVNGQNAVATSGNYVDVVRTGFWWDEENKVFYQNADLGETEKYVLAMTYVEAYGSYKMFAYKWSEVENSTTVFPVRMYTMSDCTASTTWSTDGTHHWKVCTSCGEVVESTKTTHTESDTWVNTDADEHWKTCSVCNAVVTATKAAHNNWSEWTYEATTQSRTCGTCGFVQTTALHTHTPSTDYKSNDSHHWLYCTVEGCGAEIENSRTAHTPKSGWENCSNDTQHWNACSVCEEAYGHANHNYTGDWQKNDTQHWKTCECGKTNPTDHVFGEWANDSATGGLKRSCESGQSESATVLEEGLFYLSAKIDGVDYYFRGIREGEATNQTKVLVGENYQTAHSLWATNVASDADQVTVIRAEREGTIVYHLKFMEGETVRYIYINDETPAGIMDTARTANTDVAARVDFLWDSTNGLYQDEAGVKYVLAFKQMYNSVKQAEEWRLVGVPMAEVNGTTVVRAELKKSHTHEYTGDYQKDADGHWQKCECGQESAHEDHKVTNWTVEKAETETESGSKYGNCDVCGYKVTKEIPPQIKVGTYYLTGVLNGTTYYFRMAGKDANGNNEGVTSTKPYSLYTTSDKTLATLVDVDMDKEAYTYTLGYLNGTTVVRIYVDAVVADDPTVHTGTNSQNTVARHHFSWDAVNKVLYQMEGDVKYVLAFKEIKNNTTDANEVRLLAVPVSELSDSVVAMKLELAHAHSYGESWEKDAANHWHVCACGSKADEATHSVTEWKVTKEATETEDGTKTGKCDVCGHEMTLTINATGKVVEPPKDGQTGYLSVEINGVRYFLRHTINKGESVTTTTPYSLYTTNKVGEAATVIVKADGDGYTLNYIYGDNNTNYRIYVTGSGVGVNGKPESYSDEKNKFFWDEENNVLYQMEGDVKHVLVFKTMGDQIRLTAVPLTEALADSNVYIVELTTDVSANTGDASMVGTMAIVMILSMCAMAFVVSKKKWF